MNKAVSVLVQVSLGLSQLKSSFQVGSKLCHPLASVLVSLPQKLQTVVSQFEAWNSTASSSPCSNKELAMFRDNMNELMTEIMLVIQNFVKRKGENLEENEKEDDEEGEDEVDLQDKHLTQRMLKDLASDVDLLRLEVIIEKLSCLVSSVTDAADQRLCTYPMVQMLADSSTALEAFTKLVEFVITQVICSQRATNKLLSVLLGIFTELTEKVCASSCLNNFTF
jgi:hypothetical protein